jgi:MFS family permease
MRRLRFSIYALVFLEEVAWLAIVPVAPSYAEKFALSKFEIGAVLASAGFTTLLSSVPAGVVADRLGARAVTVASGCLLALSGLGQGFATDFWSLLAARCLVGFALGGIWTAGVAWLSDAGPAQETASAIGRIIAVSGLGIMIGTAFAGFAADRFGLGAPFFALAAASTVATAALVVASRGASRVGGASAPFLDTVRRAGRDHLVLASLLAMLLLGFMGGGVHVLVPLQLRANGLSAGEIGLAFTAASTIFSVVSAAVAREGSRAATLRVAGAAALLFGLPILIVLVSSSTAAVLAFVLIRAPFWATLNTIAYPLAVAGAWRAGVGRGAVVGVLNLAWGAASVVGPLVAGGLAQAGGERWAYLPLLAGALAAAAWLLAASEARRAGEAGVAGASAEPT